MQQHGSVCWLVQIYSTLGLSYLSPALQVACGIIAHFLGCCQASMADTTQQHNVEQRIAKMLTQSS